MKNLVFLRLAPPYNKGLVAIAMYNTNVTDEQRAHVEETLYDRRQQQRKEEQEKAAPPAAPAS